MVFTTFVAGGLVALIVGLVVVVALAGWAGQVPLPQRLGLCLIAAGMVWAGPDRLASRPVGLGDVLMLLGILVYALAVYGPQLRDHLDGWDGQVDGRFLDYRGHPVLDPRVTAAGEIHPRAVREATHQAIESAQRTRERRGL